MREKKEELLTTSLEFEHLHQKSWREMLIGGDDISNDIITLGMCFSMFVYIYARFCFMLIGRNLTAQSTGSHRRIGGGIQIPEGHSWKLSFLFPPGELACRLVASSLNTVLYPNLTAMHLVQQANSSPGWWEKQDWLLQQFVTATIRQSLFFFLLTQKERRRFCSQGDKYTPDRKNIVPWKV